MSKLLRIPVVVSIIFLLASSLRLISLSEIPSSLYWDEVSIGYNAYSILHTGRDEYGVFLPLLFEGYNDYKLPVDIYLTAISVFIFGLTEFGVRFPSALLGSVSVVIFYLLVKELLQKTKFSGYYQKIAIVSSLLLAVSPWHIQFSRANFEANIALFFIMLGVFLFLKSMDKFVYLIPSMLSLVLAMYTYRSAVILIPVLVMGLIILYQKKILRYGTVKVALIGFSAIILLMPLGKQLLGSGSTRFDQTSIRQAVNDEMSRTINGDRKITYVNVFIKNYIANFTPQFLFISGDPNPRHSPRGMGMMYWWELPFLLAGGFILLKLLPFNKKIFILLWLLAAPLPAALSIPSPHALRTLNMMPMLYLFVGVGMVYMANYFSGKKRTIYISILSFIIIFSFIKFATGYINSATTKDISVWGNGYEELADLVFEKEENYKKIIITGHYWQPYMYFLFYSKFDPYSYQMSGSSTGFGKYIFGGTLWDKDRSGVELHDADLKEKAGSSDVLVVLSPEEYATQKENIEKIDSITGDGSKDIFIIGEVK